MIDFIIQHNINVSTSLDGNEFVHNANRPYQNDGETFSDVINSINKLRKKGIFVGAIQTTTKTSLSYYREIVDAYTDLGLKHPLFYTPYGLQVIRINNVWIGTDVTVL